MSAPTPGNTTSATANTATTSFSHTTVTGNNRYLFVCVEGWVASASTPTVAVTYNGVSMTQVVGSAASSADDRAYWFKLASPATGANSVAVTITNSTGATYAITAADYHDVDPTTPVGNTNSATGNSSAPSVTVTTRGSTDDHALDALSWDGSAVGASPATMGSGGNRTSIYDAIAGSEGGAVSRDTSPASSNAMGWTLKVGTTPTASTWAMAAIVVQGIVASSPTPSEEPIGEWDEEVLGLTWFDVLAAKNRDVLFDSDMVEYQAGGTTTPQSLTGGITLGGGALLKQVNKPVVGSFTPSGVLTKQTQKPLTGSLTLTGALARLIAKALTGSITLSGGVLAAVKIKVLALTGALTLSGATIVRSTGKALTGALTLSAALAKRSAKGLTGSFTPSGALAKQAQKPLTGSTTLTGSSIVKQTKKTLTGAVSLAGVVTKLVSRALTGSVTLTGGAISAVKVKLLSLVGSISPSGTLTKVIQKPLTGSITLTASLVKQIAKSLTGAVTLTGGAISAIKVKLLSLVGSIALSGSIAKRVSKPLSAALTLTGVVTKRTAKSLAGSIALSATFNTGRLLAKALTGSITVAGSITKQTSKGLVGALGLAATLTKKTSKALTGSVSLSGALSTVKGFVGAVKVYFYRVFILGRRS